MEAIKTFLFAAVGYSLLFAAFLFVFTFVVGALTRTNIAAFASLNGKKESRLFFICILLSVATLLFFRLI